MPMRLRVVAIPMALAAAVLLVLGVRAAPARADVDPVLVAQSVIHRGYYVDSHARYLKSDADLDRLRAALDEAGHAGVIVLPAGTQVQPVLTRLRKIPNWKGTYAVLAGGKLSAHSTILPEATVHRLVDQATTRGDGDPQRSMIAFLTLLSPEQGADKKKAKPGTPEPGGAVAPTAVQTPAAQEEPTGTSALNAKKAAADDGGLPYGLIGGIVGAVIVLGAGAGLLLRRRRSAAVPGGGADAAGSPPGEPVSNGPAQPRTDGDPQH